MTDEMISDARMKSFRSYMISAGHEMFFIIIISAHLMPILYFSAQQALASMSSHEKPIGQLRHWCRSSTTHEIKQPGMSRSEVDRMAITSNFIEGD